MSLESCFIRYIFTRISYSHHHHSEDLFLSRTRFQYILLTWLKLGFFFMNWSCFSFIARKRLVNATFLPFLDYIGIIYMNASAHYLHLLDSVHHGALRFITGCKLLAHHCALCSLVDWSSLAAWFIGIILSINLFLLYWPFIYQSTYLVIDCSVGTSLNLLFQ